MSEISVSQSHLSEELQLLTEFGYSDLDMPYQSVGVRSNKDIREPETHSDMRVLEVIATCLTTGKPGDVVAAAFDKRRNIRLLLAKNGDVGSTDYTATRTFISDLMIASDWIDLLPFLVNHSKTNIDKRICGLHRSITDIRSTLEKAATEYTFESMEKEFPRSDDYRDIMYVGEDIPTVARVLSDLIQECINASDFAVDEDQQSFMKYVRLVNVAGILRDSRFLSQLISDPNRKNWERIQDAVKLKRRLGKVCQYTRIRQLIEKVQRLPNIPFEWVEESFSGTGEGEFKFCMDPMEAVGRVLHRQLTSKEIYEVAERFPSLSSDWMGRRFYPRIHAELRIILHISPSLLSESLGQLPLQGSEQLPIGCSKRSCLCCVLWIDAFNSRTGMSWMTSGSHGKPYANWALPGTAGEQIGAALRGIDGQVAKGINTRLKDMLAWLNVKGGPKRISDERASSGSESDTSEHAGEMRRARLRAVLAGDYAAIPRPKE